VILPILLVLLAGAISLAVALSAFIVSRACGKSAFHAICYAAVTFSAALTLILLTLTFVQSAGYHEYMHPRGGPPTTDPFVITNDNSEELARIPGLSKTHVRVAGYVTRWMSYPDERDSGRHEKVELRHGNGSTA
jgi:hypothetical protein